MEASKKTVVGLQITDLDPMIPEFGETHTAYFETAEEAIEAAEAYKGRGDFRLRIVWERLTAEGWKAVESMEVA